jgi:hypothetical protein
MTHGRLGGRFRIPIISRQPDNERLLQVQLSALHQARQTAK